MTKREKYIRRISLTACELFAIVTIVVMIAGKHHNRLLLAAATPLILLAPLFIERVFRCKMALPVYLFALFYAIGPALGQCYNLYYTVSWWDKMLHISGGVMFAFFGLFLFERFVGNDKKKRAMTAVFALCFSMAIAVLWEFCEFGADTFLGMDMQDDTVVTHINSYLLDEGVGAAGSIEDIEEVIVNGQKLPVKGYIDIGLTDTILDMLLESLGAAVVAILYMACQGKFTVFQIMDGAEAQHPASEG